MWKLKWKKQWIEKHFSEKDKFGHCDMHRTYHEKDVIGDVVFEDYNKALYLAKSMTEITKIGHEVIPALNENGVLCEPQTINKEIIK